MHNHKKPASDSSPQCKGWKRGANRKRSISFQAQTPQRGGPVQPEPGVQRQAPARCLAMPSRYWMHGCWPEPSAENGVEPPRPRRHENTAVPATLSSTGGQEAAQREEDPLPHRRRPGQQRPQQSPDNGSPSTSRGRPAKRPCKVLELTSPTTAKRQRKQEEAGGVRRRSDNQSEEGESPETKRPGQQSPRQAQDDPCRPARRMHKARLEKLYTKGPLLGKGGYGSVFAGIRKSDGAPVAIKYVCKSQAEEELNVPGQGRVPLEVALMQKVAKAPSCPSILRLLEWYDQPSRYVMVLERPEPCQDLIAFCQDRGGFMSESLARQVMLQLMHALKHCTECGVLHRDVKPENLLIQTDSYCVKLFDFGCGDLLKDTAYKDFIGTLEYTPPEFFLQRQYLAGPATVWSVGVTLYNLVCGFLPFDTVREIINGRLHFTKGLSPECRQLIRWCLTTKPSDRPSLEQIRLHPWLQ